MTNLLHADDNTRIGLASATTITDEQRRKAIAAVVWRYQRENWPACELVEVLEALGLAGEDRPRRLRKGW